MSSDQNGKVLLCSCRNPLASRLVIALVYTYVIVHEQLQLPWSWQLISTVFSTMNSSAAGIDKQALGVGRLVFQAALCMTA